MRVAMVSEHASPLAVLGGVDAGGQNVHVAALSKALAARGADVVVHTRRDAADLPQRVALAQGAVVDHVPAGPAATLPKDDLWPHMQEFAEGLHARWKQDRPDVVHAHFWMSGWAAVAAASRLGIPVTHTFHALGVVKRRHQGELDTSPADRAQVERDLVRGADRIVATCTDEVFELLRLGAERSRVSVVPCGVDLGLFSPRGPQLERTPGLRRVVSVGRLVARKGVGHAIEALGLLRAGGGPDTELLVAGGPRAEDLATDPEVARLRAVAADAGVADRVRFLGQVARDDLPALFRSADLAVCVPWYEPFGIVPLEAMACGVPVVASAVGGLVDTVVDGGTGLHVPPRSPAAVADAYRAVLDDETWRRGLARAAVSRVRTRYSWDRVAAMTLQAYADLLDSRSRPLSQGVSS